MNENISFYNFMHKQILVVIALFVVTSPGYVLLGYYFHNKAPIESIWFIVVIAISLYGYLLYREFDLKMSLKDKDRWLKKVQIFMFSYFSIWTVIFTIYVLKSDITMHYIALATQLGSTVVAATILASQKRLVVFTVISMMAPITTYLLCVGEFYSYLLAFFSVVVTIVLLYAAKNTYSYLVKSRFQAYHDQLTTLGNRRYFLEILESTIKQTQEGYVYLLLIDLDYFKTINDTLGHDVGDELLKKVAQRMLEASKATNNKVARLGGDEFCVLSNPFTDEDSCKKEAKIFSTKLLKELKENYLIDGNTLYISASIGISIINSQKIETSAFLKEADMAMYEAKRNGRDGIIIFSDAMCEAVERKLEIERLMHFAIKNQEISLVYQPQVDVNKKIVGCEVLVRWQNEKLGMIGPNIFIPMSEKTGYIIELGAYIMEESFKTIHEWGLKGIALEQVSINISMRQLLHQDFINNVYTLLQKYEIAKNPIEIIFEITETSAADDLHNLIKIMNKLKKYRIRFSMDDFGTGYSSLSYLREIPISELKIDQSFVSQLDDIQQASLVKTIIEISKNLELTIVAEGVEEEYQREFLADLDCDLYQGYLFSKPLPKLDFEKFCMQ